ncbi:MAG TPA: amino acid adenylation domain-containing protein [Thermoanaerobaculia bacterium]|nr:amino acid adenylation domain-containing protein [Thermoanaerobaculia bacterium]
MSRPPAQDLEERLAALSPEQRELLDRRLKERVLESGRADTIPHEPGLTEAPLSFSQQRIWFMDRLESEGSAYNVPTAVRLRGPLDEGALCRALEAIQARHASLRTRFPESDGVPVQRIEKHASVSLPVLDLSDLPLDERERKTRRLIRDEAATPFDLARGPVFRAKLVRLAPEEHVFLCTLHHIVSDGWSRTLLFRELSESYDAYASAKKPALSPLPIQYADYAVWQQEGLRSGRMQSHLEYWRTQLRNLPMLDLPTDHPRPAVQTLRGDRCELEIPGEVARALKAFCREEGVTLFMAVLSAFALLLRGHSGQDDLVVGTLTANRNRIETEGLIGIFINALAMRVDLSGNPTFRDLVRRVREVALEAYAHEDVPFEKVVQTLQPERDPARSPIYQTMVNVDTAPSRTVNLPGLLVEDLTVPEEVALLDLTLTVRDRGGELTGWLEYNADLFEAETIRRMSGHFGVILSAVVANPDQRVAAVPLLTEVERRRVLFDWNETDRDYAANRRLHELFEERAAMSPRAVALREGPRDVEYGELNRDANRLARYLRSNGVGPGSIVGVCLERSARTVTALLAIFKAGAAYVPLDPSYPEERLAFMLKDSGAGIVLTEAHVAPRFEDLSTKEIRLDEIASEVARQDAHDLSTPGTSEDLAYVIYTSGSTGIPKGVEAIHRASVNRFAWMWQAYPFEEGEICCQKTSLSFVDSIWEIFGPLLAGVPSVIFSQEESRDPRILVHRLASERVSRIVLVPSLLSALLDSGIEVAKSLSKLKWWITSGEALPFDLYRRFRELMPGAVLINLYGSSEVSADVTCWDSRGPEPLHSVPIGRPISNTQVYVLDEARQPVAIGVSGEIYVGGVGLARGYRNRPDLTAERFVPDPFRQTAGARLFKTGDRARHLPGGDLEYLGRNDDQVKIRGYRIELGEIQAALTALPSVEKAVMTLDGSAGEQRLVAYVVSKERNSEALRSGLASRLPEFMIPAAFVFLDAFPLTPSGKIDKKALPAPHLVRPELQASFVAPSTPTERALAKAWQDVLGLDHVGVHDNFFSLGGHSLLMIQVAARLRDSVGVELPLRTFFEAPTIAGLALQADQAVPGEREQVPAIRPAPGGAPFPLSFAQQRLWLVEQLNPGSAAYLIRRAYRLEGPLRPEALQQALDAVVARHDTLRTSFVASDDDEGARQDVARVARVPLVQVDISSWPAERRREEASALMASEGDRPFDLGRGPLLRAHLLRLGPAEHLFLVTLHHLVGDAWSIGILLQEVATQYEAVLKNEPCPMPPLPIQYGDYAVWQREWLRGERLQRMLSHWRRELQGAPEVFEVESDRRRPLIRTSGGARRALAYSRRLAEDLRVAGRSQDATLFMTLAAAYAAFLSGYTRQEEILIGSPIAGRNSVETEPLIGLFVNTLVLRATLSGDPTFSELVARVRERALKAFEHQDLPFEKLVEELRPARSTAYNPLFQVWFVLQNAPTVPWELPGVRSAGLDSVTIAARHDLQLTMWETTEGLGGSLDFSTDMFNSPTMDRMTEDFGLVLRTIGSNFAVRLSELREIRREADVGRNRLEQARLEQVSARSLTSARRKAIRE